MTSQAGKIASIYRRHADAWASRRGQDLLERTWLDRFLALLPPNPSVLDIGCGSGLPIGKYLCQKGSTVTGIDVSPEMIDIATKSIAEADLIVADMRTLDLPTTFDGLLAWNSFFHAPHDTAIADGDEVALFPPMTGG